MTDGVYRNWLEWAWVGGRYGGVWLGSGDAHNSYCSGDDCGGNGVHDYNGGAVVLADLAMIVLTMVVEPVRVMVVGVAVVSMVITSVVIV